MIKTITKIGNSQGIIFDNTLMQLAHLKVGDLVNVEVHPGGTITIASVEQEYIATDVAASTARLLISLNDELFRKLS